MNSFSYIRADDVATAVREMAGSNAAQFIAGGTNLIDLMKENVARPSRLIDISRLPLDRIEETADGGLRLGALVAIRTPLIINRSKSVIRFSPKRFLRALRRSFAIWRRTAAI
jgi:CO/xanthine dehydrogenase FAD-binding subunit